MESSSPKTPRGLRRTIGLLAIAMRLVRDANPRVFALAITMQVISGIGVGVLLFVTQHALGTLLALDANHDVMTIVPDLVLLVVVLIASGVVGAIQGGLGRLQVEYTVRHVRGRILDVAGTVDLEHFELPAFYDRLKRAIEQGLPAPLQISMGLLGLVSGVVGILGIALALATIQPVLLPIVAVACIPRWLVSKRNIDEMYQFRFGHTPDERARFYLETVLHERDPAKEVRAFSLFTFLKRRWTVLYAKRIDELAVIARRHVRRTVIASVVSSTVIAAMLLLLVMLFVEGQMDVAGVATAGLALQQLGSRLQGLGGHLDRLYESSRFVDDYAAFVALAAPAESTGSAPAPPRFQRLTAEAVSYSYPDATRPAVDGVSLEIRGDEIVALVGENGSGKTTLAKLLCALYRPSSGRIRWDDQDIAACDPRELRESIAVIFQDFVRYQLTVRENIGAGRHSRLDDGDAISAASRAAGAEGFVAELPAGHDTILGRQFDGGADLSIGQWQRVAMARAFFRDAPFLVLDEPTAALDPRAEQALFTNIRTLCAGRAVLLISHRFSTVRSADRIYVLHEGRLEESGTHDELMARRGRYAELFTLQASAYLDVPPRAVEP